MMITGALSTEGLLQTVQIKNCDLPTIEKTGIIGSFSRGTELFQVILWASRPHVPIERSLDKIYPNGIKTSIGKFGVYTTMEDNSYYEDQFSYTGLQNGYTLNMLWLKFTEKEDVQDNKAAVQWTTEPCAVKINMPHKRYNEEMHKTPGLLVIMFHTVCQGQRRKFLFKQNCRSTKSGICAPLYVGAQKHTAYRTIRKKGGKHEEFSNFLSKSDKSLEITFKIKAEQIKNGKGVVNITHVDYETTVLRTFHDQFGGDWWPTHLKKRLPKKSAAFLISL
eukprot:GHVS01001731.1.p1 GENE.GHVS01001731.1~~GHVS01001731.1.p1  ORF type:complete len:278 (+),score=6.38 GHVS01001731.1:158-991(+)